MVRAQYTAPPLPLTLYIRDQQAGDVEQLGPRLWEGRGRIAGWDDRHGRLQIRLD